MYTLWLYRRCTFFVMAKYTLCVSTWSRISFLSGIALAQRQILIYTLCRICSSFCWMFVIYLFLFFRKLDEFWFYSSSVIYWCLNLITLPPLTEISYFQVINNFRDNRINVFIFYRIIYLVNYKATFITTFFCYTSDKESISCFIKSSWFLWKI